MSEATGQQALRLLSEATGQQALCLLGEATGQQALCLLGEATGQQALRSDEDGVAIHKSDKARSSSLRAPKGRVAIQSKTTPLVGFTKAGLPRDLQSLAVTSVVEALKGTLLDCHAACCRSQ